MMTNDQIIAVIEAAKAGKQIEFRPHFGVTWLGVTGEPGWNFSGYDYRARPEPKPDVVQEYWAKPGLIRNADRVDTNFMPNLRLTFSEETGQLKLAEVLK